jgi:hypothetical protein
MNEPSEICLAPAVLCRSFSVVFCVTLGFMMRKHIHQQLQKHQRLFSSILSSQTQRLGNKSLAFITAC